MRNFGALIYCFCGKISFFDPDLRQKCVKQLLLSLIFGLSYCDLCLNANPENL